MADHTVVANHSVMGCSAVNYRAILYRRSRTDHNFPAVGTSDGARPDTGVRTHPNIPDHNCIRVNERGWIYERCFFA